MVEPVLISIASSLAAKSAGSIYDLVRARLAKNPEENRLLDKADGAEQDSPQVRELAEVLERVEQRDPAFGAKLRTTWAELAVDHSGVSNHICGTVSGNVLQARDIQGDITL